MIILKDFHADWCAPCRMQRAILGELKKEYKGKVDFETIDVDVDRKKAERLGIKKIPTLVLEKNGRKVGEFVGLTPREVIKKALQKALGKK